MTNSHPHNKPSPGQLRLLRILAEETGSSFSYPATFDAADREIKRMKKLKKTSRSDRRREMRELRTEMAERRGDSARVRSDELAGYGSSASWSRG